MPSFVITVMSGNITTHVGIKAREIFYKLGRASIGLQTVEEGGACFGKASKNQKTSTRKALADRFQIWYTMYHDTTYYIETSRSDSSNGPGE